MGLVAYTCSLASATFGCSTSGVPCAGQALVELQTSRVSLN